ncbi:MAG: c-type cytochrome [Nitrospirae bacterium YQR-1]
MKRILLTILLTVVLCSAWYSPAGADDSQGKKLYNGWCAQCHGYDGDAKSYTDKFSVPKPRDFTMGTYKFRSTPSGDPPTDADITKVVRDGNPGTSMPPWDRFTDDEVKAIVAHVKTFAPDAFKDAGKPITIGTPPKASADLIAKGKELFNKAKCVECHGTAGRGNGEKGWQDNFKNDWGDSIMPADYTHPWELRNGSAVEDIYRTISVGLSGTPMTSYMDSLKDEDRWALAVFIKSLQQQRKLGVALKVKKAASIPAKADDPAWDSVEFMDLPMGGQLMFEPRDFTPLITNVRVRGLYTDKELAFMVEWSDKKPNNGSDGKPADSIWIQFPVKVTEAVEKPYFFMGDKKHPVFLWNWKASAAGDVVEQIAKGNENVEDLPKKDVTVITSYNDGLYRVVYKRALKTGGKDDFEVIPGKFVPFSIAAFDGQNGESGIKGAVSAWYYLMLEPSTPLKVYVLPPLVALFVLVGGVSLSRSLKSKK